MSYIIVGSQQNNRGRRSLQIVQLAQVMTQPAYRYSVCNAYCNNVCVSDPVASDRRLSVCLSVYVSPDSHRSACGDSGVAYHVYCTKQYRRGTSGHARTHTHTFVPPSLSISLSLS